MQFLSYHACQANSVLLTEGHDAFFTASIIAGEASINKRCTGDIESCGYVAYVCLCVFMCVLNLMNLIAWLCFFASALPWIMGAGIPSPVYLWRSPWRHRFWSRFPWLSFYDHCQDSSIRSDPMDSNGRVWMGMAQRCAIQWSMQPQRWHNIGHTSIVGYENPPWTMVTRCNK